MPRPRFGSLARANRDRRRARLLSRSGRQRLGGEAGLPKTAPLLGSNPRPTSRALSHLDVPPSPPFCPGAALHVAPAIELHNELLGEQLPSLRARLDTLGIRAEVYLVPWFLTMFTRSLPLSTPCRIWDRVLLDGEAHLFRAALGLLQLLQPVLMLAGFEESIQLLQHLPLGAATSALALPPAPSEPASLVASPQAAARQLPPPPSERARYEALAERFAEEDVLAAMARVHIPEAAYERMVARCMLRTDDASPESR